MENPHKFFMEAAQQLCEEGTTPEAINKLRRAGLEGHKLARYLLAILYHAAIEEMFR